MRICYGSDPKLYVKILLNVRTEHVLLLLVIFIGRYLHLLSTGIILLQNQVLIFSRFCGFSSVLV